MGHAYARRPAGGAEVTADQPVAVELAESEDVDFEEPGKEEACGNDSQQREEDGAGSNGVEGLPVSGIGDSAGCEPGENREKEPRGANDGAGDEERTAGLCEEVEAEFLSGGGGACGFAAVSGEEAGNDGAEPARHGSPLDGALEFAAEAEEFLYGAGAKDACGGEGESRNGIDDEPRSKTGPPFALGFAGSASGEADEEDNADSEGAENKSGIQDEGVGAIADGVAAPPEIEIEDGREGEVEDGDAEGADPEAAPEEGQEGFQLCHQGWQLFAFLMPALLVAESKNPADYPLRVHIFGRDQTTFCHSHMPRKWPRQPVREWRGAWRGLQLRGVDNADSGEYLFRKTTIEGLASLSVLISSSRVAICASMAIEHM